MRHIIIIKRKRYDLFKRNYKCMREMGIMKYINVRKKYTESVLCNLIRTEQSLLQSRFTRPDRVLQQNCLIFISFPSNVTIG